SCNGTPTRGAPWQFFRNTRIVIPVPANVSPVPAGEIVIRSLAGLVKATVQYDESGQTMSAAAIAAMPSMAKATSAAMSRRRSIARPPLSASRGARGLVAQVRGNAPAARDGQPLALRADKDSRRGAATQVKAVADSEAIGTRRGFAGSMTRVSSAPDNRRAA